MADLYQCQKKLWETPVQLKAKMDLLTNEVHLAEVQWRFEIFKPNGIRISGEIEDDSYILIQIFPGENFISMDIFSWGQQIDFQSFREGLIELFTPQVVAVETKIRAEHL